MPKIFEKDGYRFFFNSNEQRPIHVHVRYGGGEAVFDMEPAVELRESLGLKSTSFRALSSLRKNIDNLSLRSGMSTLIDTPRSARFEDGFIVVVLRSGAELRFPAKENPRLAQDTPEQLNRIEVSPFGLHWPELDEDLSIRGIIQGDYGHHRREMN